MSDVVKAAVAALGERVAGFDGTAKFVIEDEGAIMVDGGAVRAGDEPAEVTLRADRDTFEGMLDGTVNPTMAFMSGKLKIEGDMALALKLGAALS